MFHAAAYKHVPLMEWAPDEAVLNNIRGTGSLQRAPPCASAVALQHLYRQAVGNPFVSWLTKRASELLLRALSRRYVGAHGVRALWNVRGSVIPVFRKQIENGGLGGGDPPDVKRYFMTTEEAVQLVLLQADLMEENGHLGSGADIYVLEMGDPISIVELAHQMISICTPIRSAPSPSSS